MQRPSTCDACNTPTPNCGTLDVRMQESKLISSIDKIERRKECKYLAARLVLFTYLYKLKRSASVVEFNEAFQSWRQFKAQNGDLNDVFDRNDISSILRDVSADVKKCCVGLEAPATAAAAPRSRALSNAPPKESVRRATNDVDGDLKDEVRQLAAAVAANTQRLAGMQVRSRVKAHALCES